MGFDITLMGCFGGERVFDHQISLSKACVHVAMARGIEADDIRMHAFGRARARRAFADDRRAVFHGFVDVGNVVENFVIDLDQL